ncbi:MAG: hypothetical protein AB7K36_06075 [Chloroflexota bacterium]
MVGVATFRKLKTLETTLAVGDGLQLGKPPSWATDLVAQIAAELSRTDLPTLLWWRMRQYRWSSGLTQATPMLKRQVITVRQGNEPVDATMVLLHELAHWLVGTTEQHSERFYAQAFRLYAAHGDVEHAFRRELRYKRQPCLGGIRGAGLDRGTVLKLLEYCERQTRSILSPDVRLLLSADGQSIVEVRTDHMLSVVERMELEERLRTLVPLTTVMPLFSVAAPGEWLTLRGSLPLAQSAAIPR